LHMPDLITFTWHGSASFSIRLGDTEILVDPYFSSREEYGDWYIENRNRPRWADFCAHHSPDYVFISHGHFDHFDLHTVKRIDAAFSPVFVGSEAVTQALRKYFSIPQERLLAVDEDTPFNFGDHPARVHRGLHWLTEAEGDEAARKLDRPERYGVMPCGGPMYGFSVQYGGRLLYVSGDTEPEGVPSLEVDVAVLFLGGTLPHPVTKVEDTPTLTPSEAAEVVRAKLRPDLVLPIHWDFAYAGGVDVAEIKKVLTEAVASYGGRVLLPPLHTPVAI